MPGLEEDNLSEVSKDSFTLKQEDDIKNLQKAANELKMLKK